MSATESGNPRKSTPSSLSNLLGKDKENDNKVDKVEPTTNKSTDKSTDKKVENPSVIRPADIKPPVDNTVISDTNTGVKGDKSDTFSTSDQVVATVPNKTPNELSSETAAQTAARYGIDQKITDEDADNPNVQVYRDTHVNQVPSGTHLHPDIAKDLLNRGISEQHTDNAQVKRTVTEYYDFAPDAENNDKFVKPAKSVPGDGDSDKYDADGNIRSDWKPSKS